MMVWERRRVSTWAAAFGCGMVMVGAIASTLARAAPPVASKLEISFLLHRVETSGCEFYRNGTWYDSKRASAHLEKKYDYLVSRDQIKSAEEFIAKAGTSSSLSGQVYQIRCAGSEPQASGRWFTDALAAYRLANKAGR